MRGAFAGLVFAFFVAVSGCAGAEPRTVVVVREDVLAPRAPPVIRQEVIVARPGPVERYVWRAGYWRWDGRDYDWVPGAWIERPGPRHVWVAEHWVRRPGGWAFVPGHWRR